MSSRPDAALVEAPLGVPAGTVLVGLDRALAFTLSRPIEGGWYAGDKPWDPNPTMNGFTQATYTRWLRAHGQAPRSVRYIAYAEKRAIAESDYWLAGHCHQIAVLLEDAAVAHFDACFNLGPGHPGNEAANGVLQRAVGVAEEDVDGLIGPRTLARLAIAVHEPAAFVARLVDERRAQYHRIVAHNPAKAPALHTWLDRCDRLERFLQATPTRRQG